MMSRPAIAACLALLAGAACSATISDRGVSGVPGEEAWKTEVELRPGGVAYVDDRGLELELVSVGVNDAIVLVSSGAGAVRRETLRAGIGGSVMVPPYEIRLLRTEIGGSAIVEVRRQWGR